MWDHLWNRTLAPFADPFVTLAAIAAATDRVLIGTLVVALPRRRTQLVAQATTSLDRLSAGRMVLGLGLGVDSYGEYSAFGEPATDDRDRGAALDAGIEQLVPMLAGDAVPGAGDRVTTQPGVQSPRVPIWVAGRAGLGAGPRRRRTPPSGRPGPSPDPRRLPAQGRGDRLRICDPRVLLREQWRRGSTSTRLINSPGHLVLIPVVPRRSPAHPRGLPALLYRKYFSTRRGWSPPACRRPRSRSSSSPRGSPTSWSVFNEERRGPRSSPRVCCR